MSFPRELLDEEEIGWRDQARRFEALSEADWLRPGACGPWTPKDLLAHIACWHAEAHCAIERVRAGADPSWPEDDDAFNSAAYERCAEMTLREVQAMSGAARHRFREEVASLTGDTAERLVRQLHACGAPHYHGHLPDLDRFLDARPPPQAR